VITSAIEEQLRKGIHLGPQSVLAGEVAGMLCELTGNERAVFCNSGTEAVMMAIRLARTAHDRPLVALFAGSYHGTFDGVLAQPALANHLEATLPLAPGIVPGRLRMSSSSITASRSRWRDCINMRGSWRRCWWSPFKAAALICNRESSCKSFVISPKRTTSP